ncbi:MAG: alpha/beta fold hydrolase [Chloroflexota bacterium]|nr:alpha/beta fold hydrolase [Dehalococcoidia bacterium]MDW8254739.1 alpha/beta fold hydrolase [Chloroflexota bacterium]
MTIERHYLSVGERRVHYRRAGSGPPLVMLHAAPNSSLVLEPLITALAAARTVIAPDAPGYGESAPLAVRRPTIHDYAVALGETLDALGLDRVDLYGSHTGAKTAVALALLRPDRVRKLVLDGYGLYTPEERDDLIAHFCPPIEPDWAGSHLVRVWALRRDMFIFWPWYRRIPEARLPLDLPTPERLHELVVDFLRGGTFPWLGHLAAFRYDGLAAIRQVSVPTLLFAGEGDPLRPHLERLTAGGTLRVEPVPAGMHDASALAERTLSFLAGDGLPPAAPPPPAVASRPGVIRRRYVPSRLGPILARFSGELGRKRPLVLFQSSPGSSEPLEPLLAELASDRFVVAFDTPGNGDSVPFPGEPTIDDLAAVLGDAIDALGIDDYDVYGYHTGALIGVQSALDRPTRVRHVIADGIPLYPPALAAELLERYAPPMTIDPHGGHLVWAWNFRRDMTLWSPWYRRQMRSARRRDPYPDPEELHWATVDFLKSATTYHVNYWAAFRYPTAERLTRLKTPALMTTKRGDSLARGVPEAARLAPAAEAQDHAGISSPEARAQTAALFRAFLDREP